MIEAIRNFFNFSNKEQEQEEEIIEEEVVERQPIQLPEQLEVPWADVTHLKNIEIVIRKTHEQLKEVLYTAKMTENGLFAKLDALKDLQKEKLIELHEKYNIPQDGSYDVELPETTGRSGFFKKAGKQSYLKYLK